MRRGRRIEENHPRLFSCSPAGPALTLLRLDLLLLLDYGLGCPGHDHHPVGPLPDLEPRECLGSRVGDRHRNGRTKLTRSYCRYLDDSQNFKAPPPMRGFFFAGRAARHQPASLLRARLKFATVQRDIEPKLLQIGSHNSERFCSNYYARRLKNESVCDSCDNHLIGSACPRSGRPREGRGEQGKESEQIERAYKDMLKRTTREQPVKKTAPWGNLR